MKRLIKKIITAGAALLLGPGAAFAAQINGNLDLLGTTLNFGTAGVRLTQDADGALTFLGLGNGNDEDLTWNFDDSSNLVTVSSSTGVTVINFSGITLQQSGNSIIDTTAIDTSAELDAIVTDDTGSGALVFASNPTLSLDWDNIWTDAVHTHQSNGEGGALDCAAITGSITGTGNCVKSASPTFSGTVGGALTWSSAQHFNSSITTDASVLITGSGGALTSANLGNGFGSFTDGDLVISPQQITMAVFSFTDNALYPVNDNTHDLGQTARSWKNLYLNGELYFDSNNPDTFINATNDHNLVFFVGDTAGGADRAFFLDGTGATTGEAYFGLHGTNTVDLNVAGALMPQSDNTYDIGTAAIAWKDVFYEGTITDTSDLRDKKDISPLNLGLDFVKKLKPVSFVMKSDKKGRTEYGFIAQDVAPLIKDKKSSLVVRPKTEAEHYGISYLQMISPMVKAIQELSEKVERLEKEKNRPGQ